MGTVLVMPTRVSEQVLRFFWAGLLLVAGCGQTERGKVETASQAGSGGSGGVGGSPEVAEAAGAPAIEPPPVDVAGRWALFVFADPVGVQLTQDAEQLSGRGCAAGTPPLEEHSVGEYCGDITGGVQGSRARFWFPVPFGGPSTYLAETIIAAGGQRMTGHFHGVGDVSWPTAWLRVAEGERWLPWDTALEQDPLVGTYELRLESAEAGADEYSSDQTYQLYFRGVSIASDLGSFWYTEMHRNSAAPTMIQIGPVAMTAPELATIMTLEHDPESISRVQAITGSGHTYVFSAVRDQ